jgi:hypothetical protein
MSEQAARDFVERMKDDAAFCGRVLEAGEVDRRLALSGQKGTTAPRRSGRR